jgi:hypothetical protein
MTRYATRIEVRYAHSRRHYSNIKKRLVGTDSMTEKMNNEYAHQEPPKQKLPVNWIII